MQLDATKIVIQTQILMAELSKKEFDGIKTINESRIILLKVSNPSLTPDDTITTTLVVFDTIMNWTEELEHFIKSNSRWITICTSQQALHSIMTHCDLTTKELFFEHRLYVIGSATLTLAKSLGFKNIEGYGSKTALELIDIISRTVTDLNELPFLFLCGDKRSDSIPQWFKEKNIGLNEFIVYKTVPISSNFIKSELLKHLEPLDVKLFWIVFFSPSIVKLVYPIIQDIIAHHSLWFRIKFASIGPTTSSSLREHNCIELYEASQPTLESLKQVIHEYNLSS
jgi:uroporphyrinogen-III synthase